jgi:ABC-2 type transport system ATP-binding protein
LQLKAERDPRPAHPTHRRRHPRLCAATPRARSGHLRKPCLEEADALCDRLAIIDHGRIVALGTPDQLKRQVAGDVVTLGVGALADEALDLLRDQPFVREAGRAGDLVRLYVERAETAMPAILRLLDGAGLGVESLAMSRPSLDDVFLHQTGRSLREVAS